MSYAPRYPIMFRRAARLVDRLLNGARPSEVPVERQTEFELTVNLKTARGLGVTIGAPRGGSDRARGFPPLMRWPVAARHRHTPAAAPR